MPIRNGFDKIDPILEIPGIDVWFDPADENLITFNGSKVNQIQNKSGNIMTAYQPVAIEQPSIDTVSRKTVIKFEGATKLTGLDLDTLGPLFFGTQFSLSTVMTRSSVISYFLSGNYTSGSPAIISKYTNNEIEYFSSGTDSATFADVNDDNLHIVTLTVDQNANYTGYFDGVQKFNNLASSPTAGASPARIGHPNGFITNTYDGLMGDFIISNNRIWNASEIGKIESYLANKWGIEI